MTKQEKPPLKFRYKNWQGEVAVRRIIPIEIWYGHTEFHSQEQWLLKAFDVEKKEERDFAINDILEFLK